MQACLPLPCGHRALSCAHAELRTGCHQENKICRGNRDKELPECGRFTWCWRVTHIFPVTAPPAQREGREAQGLNNPRTQLGGREWTR